MNRQRRKKLTKAYDKIAEAMEIVADAKDEEQEAIENLPDSFRYGERGEEMESNVEMLGELLGYLEDAQSILDQV